MDYHYSKKKFIFWSLLIFIFILACVIRFNWYLSDISFWFDELLLVMNVQEHSIWEFFKPLSYNQSAPPLFLFLVKIFTMIFGQGEMAYRFLSILCGVLSIFIFYLFSKKFFKEESLALIVSNFLFAINYYIIYYSAEVKPYIVDMLVYMLAFLVLDKLSLFKKKHILIIAFFFIVFPWLSLPSLFILTAWFIAQIVYKKFKLKSLIIVGFSYILSFGVYLFFILIPARSSMLSNGWSNIWIGRTISDLQSFFYIIKENILYEFYPNKFVLLILILLVVSWFYFIKAKRYYNNILILSFCLSIIFAFTTFYPFYQRLTLYCFPIIIIILTFPLEVLSKKYLYFIILLITLNSYNFDYLKDICFNYSSIRGNTKEIITCLKENYNEKEDYIVFNSYSALSFYYYTKNLKINNGNVIILESGDISEREFFNMLNALPKGRNIFFIKLHDTDNMNDSEYKYFDDWIKNKKIITKKILNDNFIYQIKL